MRGLKAATLVNRHVNHHGALSDAGNHGARHQLGCRCARRQHRANHQVGSPHGLFDTVDAGVDGVDAVAKHQVELALPLHVFVEHRDPRAQTDRHLQRVRADLHRDR